MGGLARQTVCERRRGLGNKNGGAKKNMNRWKTFLTLNALTALLMWGGHVPGGATGLGYALAVAAAMNIGTYWFADRIVPRIHHAQEGTPRMP